MTVGHMFMRSIIVLAALFATAALVTPPAPACAAEPGWLPKPSRGQGEKCVADTNWMRRNHMKALNHQRDDTVHDGIRTPRFSLKGCIECHAVKAADGKPVTAASDKHFCRTCHDYAAVRIDCFECHASRLGEKATTGGNTGSARPERTDISVLAQYLRSVGQ